MKLEIVDGEFRFGPVQFCSMRVPPDKTAAKLVLNAYAKQAGEEVSRQIRQAFLEKGLLALADIEGNNG